MPDQKISIRILFLALTLVAAGGFRFRCYWLCTDQTGIQEDYVEQRDQCRQFAQLKYDAMASSGTAPVQSRDAALVKLFAECMGQHGWQVPAGEDTGPAAAAAPAPPPAPATSATTKRYSYEETTTTPASALKQNAVSDKAALTRHAECDFARNSASVSHIAADRAAACDAECQNALKANPDGPLPPACPANYPRPAVTAAVVAHKVTKEAEVSPAPVHKTVTKPKPHPAPVPAKPTVVAAAKPPVLLPMPAPPPLPPKPVPPSPEVKPPVPVSVVPAQEAPAANSLLSGLLGADIALVLILLVLYAAQRYARRNKTPQRRHIPSLSAKIRGRSED